MVSNPGDTYDALKSLFGSDDALGQLSGAVKQSYIELIDYLKSEYQRAGAGGSFNAGVETGKLVTELAGLLAGGAGVVKGGVSLAGKVAKGAAKNAGKAIGNGGKDAAKTVGKGTGTATNSRIGSWTIDELSQNSRLIDSAAKNGDLSLAGRALQKHGSRESSVFPPAKGNPTAINKQGQEIVDSILNDPNK